MDENSFSACLFIISYFNVKRLLLFRLVRGNKSGNSSERKTRLVLTSVINLLHLFFFCLSLEKIVSVDLCGFVRMVFLLVEV